MQATGKLSKHRSTYRMVCPNMSDCKQERPTWQYGHDHKFCNLNFHSAMPIGIHLGPRAWEGKRFERPRSWVVYSLMPQSKLAYPEACFMLSFGCGPLWYRWACMNKLHKIFLPWCRATITVAGNSTVGVVHSWKGTDNSKYKKIVKNSNSPILPNKELL